MSEIETFTRTEKADTAIIKIYDLDDRYQVSRKKPLTKAEAYSIMRQLSERYLQQAREE